MSALVRVVIVLAMLAAAITFYAMGVHSGAFAFFIIGALLELGFWVGLFGSHKKSSSG